MSTAANLELMEVQSNLQDLTHSMESKLIQAITFYDMNDSLLNILDVPVSQGSVESLNVAYNNVTGMDLVSEWSTESISGTIRAVWNTLKKLWEMIKSAIKTFYSDIYKFMGVYLRGNDSTIKALDIIEKTLFKISKDSLKYVDDVLGGKKEIELPESVAREIQIAGKIDLDTLKVFLSATSGMSIVQFRNEYLTEYRRFLGDVIPFISMNLQRGGDLTEDRVDDIVKQWMGPTSKVSEWNDTITKLAITIFQSSGNMRYGGSSKVSLKTKNEKKALLSVPLGDSLPGNKQITIVANDVEGSMGYPEFGDHPRANDIKDTKAQLLSIPQAIELTRATRLLFETSAPFSKDVMSLEKEIGKMEKQIDRLSKDMQLDLGEYRNFQSMYRSILNVFHPRQVKVLHQIMTYEHRMARAVYTYLTKLLEVYVSAQELQHKAVQ